MPRAASRKVTEAQKRYVAGEQSYKCNNKPGYHLIGLNDYECPLWGLSGHNKGSFDKSGYEIDHIKEWSVTQNDDLENLQALCLMCHRVKTKNFTMNLTTQTIVNEKNTTKKTKRVVILKPKESNLEIPVKKVIRKKKALILVTEEKTILDTPKKISKKSNISIITTKPKVKKVTKKISDTDTALLLLTSLNTVNIKPNVSIPIKKTPSPLKKPVKKPKVVNISKENIMTEKKMIAAEKKLLNVERKLLIAEKKLMESELSSFIKIEDSTKIKPNIYLIPSEDDKHERYTKIYNNIWIFKFDEKNFELETINDEEIKLLQATKKLFTSIKNIITELFICDSSYKIFARYLWVFDESYYNFKIILTCIKFHWYHCDDKLTFIFIIFLFSNFCLQMKMYFPRNFNIINNVNLIESSTRDIRIHRDNLVNQLEDNILFEESNKFWSQILTDIVQTQKDFIDNFINIIIDLDLYFVGMIEHLKLGLPALHKVSFDYTKVVDMIKNKDKSFINLIEIGINNDVIWWTSSINEECSPLCSISPSVHKIKLFLGIIKWCVNKTF
jgi:hypothetical protein